MTSATKGKPAAKAVRPKGKPEAESAAEPEPTLFERLHEGLVDFRRHLAGEDVGVTVDVRVPTRLVGDAVACLKRAREAAGLTLAQVSARCGLRVETLSRLELGKVPNPTVDTLAKFAFGVGRVLTLGSVPAGE